MSDAQLDHSHRAVRVEPKSILWNVRLHNSNAKNSALTRRREPKNFVHVTVRLAQGVSCELDPSFVRDRKQKEAVKAALLLLLLQQVHAPLLVCSHHRSSDEYWRPCTVAVSAAVRHPS
jgi:hypothetical protein